MNVKPALKWHGGKRYLTARILALMPRHLNYVEPFAGGLSTLLARDPDDPRFFWGNGSGSEGVSEVVNDLDRLLANFWHVVGDPELFPAFLRRAEAIPFSEEMWRRADSLLGGGRVDPGRCSVEYAVRFFVHCRMSLAGRRKGFTGVTKTRTRRRMNNEVSAWLTCVEGLPAVHERLKRVLVLNRDAMKVITEFDGPQTFMYLDPPYVHGTRATTGEYRHEMTDGQHRDLLTMLGSLKGRFILSGYACPLYDGFADRHGWRRVDVEIANHSAGGATKQRKTECLWLNYPTSEAVAEEVKAHG